MKIKVLKNLTVGISCLMLALALSPNVITQKSSSQVIKPMQDSPVGIVQSRNSIKPMQDSPVGIVQSRNSIKPMQDSPVG